MKIPTTPTNKNIKLEELAAYIKIATLQRADFDVITSLAAYVCKTKIALITIVNEDELLNVSHFGIPENDLLEQQNYFQETLKARNEITTEKHKAKYPLYKNQKAGNHQNEFYFYATIPLVTKSGDYLGTITVIDTQIKELCNEQISLLRKLASQTISIFELSKKELELLQQNTFVENSNKTLEIIQSANKIGVWELDIATGITFWSELVYQIHEVPYDYNHNKTNAISFYHKDYKSIIIDAIQSAIDFNTTFDVVCLITTAKGNQRWIRSVGKREGEKLLGSFQDITELKLRELKFEGIFNSTMSFIGFLNQKGILLEVNDTALAIAGIKKEEVIGKYFWDCYWWQISKETQEKLKENFNKALHGEEIAYEVEVDIANNQTTTILFSLRPIFNDQGKVIYVIPEGRPIDNLITTRNRFDAALKGTNAGTWEWNILTKETIINERWAEILGYTLQELEPTTIDTWIELAHPDDVEKAIASLQLCFGNQQEYYDVKVRMKHKNGNWVWVLDRGKVIERTPTGKPYKMYGTRQDINLRKTKEIELAYQKQILNALYQLSPIGITLIDYETGKFIDANDKLIEPIGYSKEEFKTLSYYDVTPSQYKEKDQNAFKQLDEKGYYEKFEKEYIRKDGTTYPVAISGVLINDLNDKKLIWSFIEDISKEKEAERKTIEASNRLQTVLDATNKVSIIATDTKGTITLFNSGAEQMLGYAASEIVGLCTPKKFHIQKEIEIQNTVLSKNYNQKISYINTFNFEAALGSATTKEFTYKRKDGTTFPILLSVSAIKNDNEIVGFLGIATDITSLKKVEQEIKTLLTITQDQNDRLRNFAHIVSHNLRSHSGGMSGLLELFQMEFPEIANNEMIELLIKSADNMKQTVTDLNEVVKINLTPTAVTEINLYEVVQKTIDILTSQTIVANLNIMNLVPKDFAIKGVVAYIDSILLNLITNAIKYQSNNDNSYLKISAKYYKKFAILYFEDNGQGIDLEKYGEKLFGMYKTFHNHIDSKGIGLFITKNQIESMGGKIEVSSEVNKGTTFRIYLPL